MGANFAQGHALIVGVGGADDLPDTVNDAKAIAGILGNPGRCAYPKGQVKLLTGAKARRAAVLKGLEELAKVPSDSSVVIFFSGHGEQVGRGKKATYYLMPHAYDVDRLEQTAISGAEFSARLSDIKATRMLVLLDCCHAGGFGGAQALPQGAKSVTKAPFKKAAMPPEATKIFTNREGRVLIASSTGSELSYAGKPYSVFTTALIAALCGKGAAKEDGYVRVMDLALYSREAVVKLTADEQHPTMDFERADNFVVAYYAGGEKKAKGLPASMKEISVETSPGSARFTQNDWINHGDVTNVYGDQKNRYDNRTTIQTIFNQPDWKVGSVTQIQNSEPQIQRRDKGKRRRG